MSESKLGVYVVHRMQELWLGKASTDISKQGPRAQAELWQRLRAALVST
jgi:hypothetical protein